MADCCVDHFTGFCLDDGTPIILVVNGNVQTGWINIETGVFTAGAPPAGTVMCDSTVVIDGPALANSTTVVVPSNDISTLLVAANPNRRVTIIYNDSTAVLYVLLEAAGVSLSVFSFAIPSKSSYELNYPYTGPMCGIWDDVNGQAFVTEVMI